MKRVCIFSQSFNGELRKNQKFFQRPFHEHLSGKEKDMFGLIPLQRQRNRDNLRHCNDPLTLMQDDFGTLFDRVFGDWPLAVESWQGPRGLGP